MPDRFTERADRVSLIAQEEAKRLGHDHVGTEHILLAIVALEEGGGVQVMLNRGIDPRRVRSEIEKIVGTGSGEMMLGEAPFTSPAKEVFGWAVQEAQSMDLPHVGTEHLLFGLLREGKGVAARVLESLGLGLDAARDEVLKIGAAHPRPQGL